MSADNYLYCTPVLTSIMKRIRKGLRILGIIVIVLIVLALIAGNYFMSTYDEMDTVARIDEAGIDFEQRFVPYDDAVINTYRIGKPSNPKALLIHGSPGHWVDWGSSYLDKEILDSLCLIAYDRPGYGNTTLPAASELSIQGDVAAAVMQEYCDAEECYSVAGHSYGGGVVQQVLIDHQGQANKGIYVAGTLAPDMQQKKWYNYLASLWVFKWAIPKEMRSSNHEMMTLSEELAGQEGKLHLIKDPIILIQGTEDVLVPYETVDYYKRMKSTGVEYVIVEGMNHFIPWTNPELIKEALIGRQ
jgi:pimeloyl-ACP methyl ester carboxylesterase